MDKWNKLYDTFTGLEQSRRERERQERERVEAVRVFDQWCEQATEQAMRDIHSQIVLRAGDFERNTGCTVEILYPAHAPIAAPPEGPFMSFLHLRVAHSQVHLYSHRLSGAWPLLHMVLATCSPQSPPPSLRNRTLVSLPSCMIVQRGDGTYELRRVSPSDPTHDGEPVGVDEVVYRCFEILVDGLRRLV